MKKLVLLLLLICFILLPTAGCNNDVENTDITDELIYNMLIEEYPHYDNLKILTKKPFRENVRENVIVVISYDVDKQRFVDYRFINNKNGKINILGGGGGLAETNLNDPKPFSFSSSGGSGNDYEPYFLTYGEIFDKEIKYIRIVYSDGVELTEEIVESGYLIIREQKMDGLKSIEALDANSEVIYSIP